LRAFICLIPNRIKFVTEIIVGEDFEAAVAVFHEGSIGFHPVSRIQVVNVSNEFVVRCVDMSTNEAGAFVAFGKSLHLFFKPADVVDDTFGVGLDCL
jgi:hypothetical protein